MGRAEDKSDGEHSADERLRVPDSVSPVRVRNVDVEPQPLELGGLPELLAAFERWDAWRDGRSAPAWTDVVLMELPAVALPYTNVLDVIVGEGGGTGGGKGVDYRFRYWGSGCAALMGVECSGARLSAMPLRDEFKAAACAQLAAVRQSQNPVMHRFHFVLDIGAEVSMFVLRLPLIDEPRRVTKVITVHDMHHPGVHPVELQGLLAKA